MCKNSVNGAKLPISRKSPRAKHAGVRNGLRFQFASSPKRWSVIRQRHGSSRAGLVAWPVVFDVGPSQTHLCS